jgi:ATP-binding cassette subfamily B protein
MNSVLERSIRLGYFGHVLKKEYSFFNKFRTGDVVTRLTDDISGYPNIAWFACSGFFRALNSTSIVLFCLAVMAWLNWKLAAIAIIPLPFAVAIYVAISSKISEAYDANRKYVSIASNHLESSFSGIRVLKAYNAEGRECERFSGILDERLEKEMDVVLLSGKLQTFFQFVSHASQVLVIIAGGLMAIRGTLSLGDYYAFFTYLGFIVYPMLDLPNLLVTSRQAFVCVDRIEELRTYGEEIITRDSKRSAKSSAERSAKTLAEGSAKSSVEASIKSLANGSVQKASEDSDEVDGWVSLEGLIETIAFKNVSFRYNDDGPPVLDSLSLKIVKGERLAIVGQIGSGKSTLLNLLAGLLKPSSGDIKINGISVSDLNPTDYRKRVGYIGQEPVVFSETISQNIRFWRDHKTEAVEKAARRAQFADEIMAFTDGFDETIGQRGATISGGQKQRLTIARAVIGKPEILVMDDVTASLDADSEEAFWKDMDESHGDTTVIIVTHRLATARRADRVVLLNKGAIEDHGTFDELVDRSSNFRRMVNIE